MLAISVVYLCRCNILTVSVSLKFQILHFGINTWCFLFFIYRTNVTQLIYCTKFYVSQPIYCTNSDNIPKLIYCINSDNVLCASAHVLHK